MSKLRDKMMKLRDKTEKAASEHLLSESSKVSEAVQEERYSICQSCPNLHEATNRCKLCGCFMGVKTWMKNQKCPINKWLEEE